MLVLDDPGIGGLGVGVVDHRVALVVVGVQYLGLKADAPVFQGAQLIAKVGVDGAGVHHPVGQGVQGRLFLEVVHPQPDLGALQHPLHHGGIAAVGDALIQGVEIVVVVGKPDRQPLDDEGRQLVAGAAPLLAGVALHQFLIDVGAHQADGLLLQVFGLGDAGGGPLALDLGLSLGGSHHAPHPVEGVHVEGHVVDFAVIVGDGAVGVAVEFGKAVHIRPHLFGIGVENMGAVAVDVDSFHLLGVDVAGDMVPPVDDQAALAGPAGLLGENRTEQAGAHDQIIILLHSASPFFDDGPVQTCSSCGKGASAPQPHPFHRLRAAPDGQSLALPFFCDAR